MSRSLHEQDSVLLPSWVLVGTVLRHASEGSLPGYLTEDVVTELTRSVLLGRSVKLGILTDRPTDRGSQASYRTCTQLTQYCRSAGPKLSYDTVLADMIREPAGG